MGVIVFQEPMGGGGRRLVVVDSFHAVSAHWGVPKTYFLAVPAGK